VEVCVKHGTFKEIGDEETELRPDLGTMIRGSEVGKKGQRYIWVYCPVCLEERWAPYKLSFGWSTKRLCKIHQRSIAGTQFNLNH
jgi:hypothetical protein